MDAKEANIIYHDAEASSYDEKWSISYDERCIKYARERFEHIAGKRTFGYGMELGSGTGFFGLNLMQAGVVGRTVLTDISPGMVHVATRNGESLGLEVSGKVADAESLPFEDGTFDLVFGHAVLHHIPDVELAIREVLRVLTPGGRFVFCGEPTARGDVVARALSRATWWATSRVTQLPPLRERWAKSRNELAKSSEAAALESQVDLHTFDPDDLAALAMRAGAIDVEVATDELTASWFGWPVRTFEAAVKPGALGWGWAMFAYRSWQTLSAFDDAYASRIVPKEWFYNVSITGVRP